MFRQTDLTGEKLGLEIKRILADKKLLAEMAENSGKIAKPEATETIVNACMKLLKSRLADNTGKILAF
jgi:UDP-N-acetylglucosamine:LPS N-acetylglucosamine transferase